MRCSTSGMVAACQRTNRSPRMSSRHTSIGGAPGITATAFQAQRCQRLSSSRRSTTTPSGMLILRSIDRLFRSLDHTATFSDGHRQSRSVPGAPWRLPCHLLRPGGSRPDGRIFEQLRITPKTRRGRARNKIWTQTPRRGNLAPLLGLACPARGEVAVSIPLREATNEMLARARGNVVPADRGTGDERIRAIASRDEALRVQFRRVDDRQRVSCKLRPDGSADPGAGRLLSSSSIRKAMSSSTPATTTRSSPTRATGAPRSTGAEAGQYAGRRDRRHS